MFRGTGTNPYEEIVAKTTDENLTSENWELILNLCDKVNDEGETGARNVVAAVLKRLAHRSVNVQLYTLVLAEALSKNCGKDVHKEIASRAFTQGLEKIVTDRTTHEKVKRRTLYLIRMWAGDFEDDPNLSIMEECYQNLKSKNYKFDQLEETPPPAADDEARRKEEEELQRVLEMSVLDKGGRSNNWGNYSGATSSGNAAGSSSSLVGTSSHIGAAAPNRTSATISAPGYVPSSHPALSTSAATAARASSPASAAPTSAQSPSSSSPSSATAAAVPLVTRVRALHSFEPTEQGELPFEKGDIIKVVDRGYKDWWRGQLKGRTGIFPVNYVEFLPEPTPGELAREADQEAQVFAQAAAIDKLLNLLRGLDPAKDNLAENEEIQELYRSSVTLRPKIVKLIDKYSQKRTELVSMNENFMKARRIFDRMMEESLARHNPDVYNYTVPQEQRPNSREAAYRTQGPAPYGWNPGVYGQQPPVGQVGPTPGPYSAYPTQTPAPYGPEYAQQPYPPQGDPNAYAGAPYGPQSAVDPNHYNPQQPVYGPGPVAPDQHQPAQYGAQPQQQPLQQQQQQPQIQPQPQQQQPQPAMQPQQQPQQQPQPQQAQAQPMQQSQSQQGPPYVFDPNQTYVDPNVQAWASYYTQGGVDPSGRVYFTPSSLPPEGTSYQPPASPPASAAVAQGPAAQQQPQQQQQALPAYGATSGTSPSLAASQPAAAANPQQQGQPAYTYQPMSPAAGGPGPAQIALPHSPVISNASAQGPAFSFPPNSAGPYSAGGSDPAQNYQQQYQAMQHGFQGMNVSDGQAQAQGAVGH